jgi:rSAM/selenodomain-associated transferase 2
MISVVLPTLNAERTLTRTLTGLLDAAMAGLVRDVVVSDGGSADRTLDIADEAGCEIVRGAAGRGRQLAAGAAAARGPWLLFLHADTVLEPSWEAEAMAFMRETGDAGAAAFRFALDDKRFAARRVEFFAGLRNRVLALPYGDQGLLISKALYERLGGYADMPLMEDVDLIRRIGRAKLSLLKSRAVTSAARYRRDGFVWRPLKNLSILTLYALGVSPRTLARIYG